jgi:hypothetical protein
MALPPRPLALEARRVLALAARDRCAAQEELAALDLEQQVALVCEVPVGRRADLLWLLPEPEKAIARLPEAELCFLVKAVGLDDASAVLEHATEEQIRTCIDLDAWRTHEPDCDALDGWLGALAAASDDALERGARALDPEVLMLWIADRAEVLAKPEDDPGWSPPPGAHTLDGQFHLLARRGGDDLAALLRLLALLFERDYWLYFRLLQSAIWEQASENEEWALRWRTGRLQDLGFPTWEEAMAIYGDLGPEQRDALPAAAPRVGEWRLPVWMPELPAAPDARHAIFRAAAELHGDERRAFFYAFVALVNRVAVADRLPLGDADSLPVALEKAARVASRGLEHLAERHGMAPVALLRRAAPDRLFRVGANLDRHAAGS